MASREPAAACECGCEVADDLARVARGFDFLHPLFSLRYRREWGEWPVKTFWLHERPGAFRLARIICFVVGCDAEPGGDCKRCWA